VLPAAVSLRKQGANKGAVTSFLISTPESGVDSIAITYALLDPIMTVMRPVAAFFTAAVAGVSENLFSVKEAGRRIRPDLTCPVDGCCDGINCDPEAHRRHHTAWEKIRSGMRYAFIDFWDDLAVYFYVGLALAGLITVLIPESFFTTYLGSGLPAMLIMLAAGIPLYVCATASTPIAAALILKGASPGAALVFLLVGPATNAATLTVLLGTLGRRSTAIYLVAIAACAVAFGLLVDQFYALLGISPQAVIGQATEALPQELGLAGAIVLCVISVRPLGRAVMKLWPTRPRGEAPTPSQKDPCSTDTGLGSLPGTGCGPT
jgi:uncharacterized membrane protein YraQ (UPF0718 family)